MKTKTYAEKDGSYETVVQIVCQSDRGDGEFDFGGYKEGSLNSVIKSLEDIKEKIPEEYREKARCCIDAYTEYEDAYPSIEVWYTRPATQEEIAEVEKKAKQKKRFIEAEERRKLKELMAKYGEK